MKASQRLFDGWFDSLRRRAGRRGALALALALLWHAVIVAYMLTLDFAPPTKKVTKTTTLSIPRAAFQRNKQILTPEQRKRRQELAQEQAKKREEEEQKKAEKELKDLKGQIVDVPASPDNRPPENARFLSEFNTNTKKESKSRHRTSDYKRATNEVTGEIQQPNPVQGDGKTIAQKAQSAEEARAEKKKQQAAMEVPKVDRRDRLALSIDDALGIMKNQTSSEKAEGNSNRLLLQPGEDGQSAQEGREGREAQQPQSVKDLMPSIGVLSKIAGAPSNDFLPDDIADGEGTFLNSREFKFAPFFNRLKQSVSQHWKPLHEFRRRDPSGNIYGFQSRVTVVNVQLNDKGEVTHIDVVRSSGVDFLDREAVSAFKRAQPFPNVPKQLVKDGQTEFTFGFHIEFSNKGLGVDF